LKPNLWDLISRTKTDIRAAVEEIERGDMDKAAALTHLARAFDAAALAGQIIGQAEERKVA
jgi:hypothetical protein